MATSVHPADATSGSSLPVSSSDPLVYLESVDHVIIALPLSIARRCNAVVTKFLHSDLTAYGSALFTTITGEALIRCISYVQHEWKEITVRKEKLSILMKIRGQKGAERAISHHLTEAADKEGGGRRGKDREKNLLASIHKAQHLFSQYLNTTPTNTTLLLHRPTDVGVAPPSTSIAALLAPAATLATQPNLAYAANHLLCELASSAYYLEIPPLVDLTCQRLADSIQGKSPEEIRTTFNITNDFTPSEEEAVKQRVMERTLLYPSPVAENGHGHSPNSHIGDHDANAAIIAGFNAGIEGIGVREKLKLKLRQKRALEIKESKEDHNPPIPTPSLPASTLPALTPTPVPTPPSTAAASAAKKKKKKKAKKKGKAADMEGEEGDEEDEGANGAEAAAETGSEAPPAAYQVLKRMASSLSSQISSAAAPSAAAAASHLPAVTPSFPSSPLCPPPSMLSNGHLAVAVPAAAVATGAGAGVSAVSAAATAMASLLTLGNGAGATTAAAALAGQYPLTAAMLSSAGPPMAAAFPFRHYPKEGWITLRLIFIVPVSPYGVHLLHAYLPGAAYIYTGLTLTTPGSAPNCISWRADPFCSPMVHVCFASEQLMLDTVRSVAFIEAVQPLLRFAPHVLADMWDMWRTGKLMRCCSDCGLEGHLHNDDHCLVKQHTLPPDTEAKRQLTDTHSHPPINPQQLVTLRLLFRLSLVPAILPPLRALLRHALFVHLGFHPLYVTPTHMLHVTFADKEAMRACLLHDVPSIIHLMHTPPRIELFDVGAGSVMKACDQCGSCEHGKHCPLLLENPSASSLDASMLPPTSFSSVAPVSSEHHQAAVVNQPPASSASSQPSATSAKPQIFAALDRLIDDAPSNLTCQPPPASKAMLSSPAEGHAANGGSVFLSHDGPDGHTAGGDGLQGLGADHEAAVVDVQHEDYEEDEDSAEDSHHLSNIIDAKLSGLHQWEQHQLQYDDHSSVPSPTSSSSSLNNLVHEESDLPSEGSLSDGADDSRDAGVKCIKAHQGQLLPLFTLFPLTHTPTNQPSSSSSPTAIETTTVDATFPQDDVTKQPIQDSNASTDLPTIPSDICSSLGSAHVSDDTEQLHHVTPAALPLPAASIAEDSLHPLDTPLATTPIVDNGHALSLTTTEAAASTAASSSASLSPSSTVSISHPPSCASCSRYDAHVTLLEENERKLLRLLEESSMRMSLLEERLKRMDRLEERMKRLDRVEEKLKVLDKCEERLKQFDKLSDRQTEQQRKVDKKLAEESKKRSDIERWIEEQQQLQTDRDKQHAKQKEDEKKLMEKRDQDLHKKLTQRLQDTERDKERQWREYRDKLELERSLELQRWEDAKKQEREQRNRERAEDVQRVLQQDQHVLQQLQLHSEILMRMDRKIMAVEQMIVGNMDGIGNSGGNGMLTSRQRIIDLVGFDIGD